MILRIAQNVIFKYIYPISLKQSIISYSTNHVTYIYHVYCTRKYTLHLLFMVNNGVHPKIKNIFCGIWWCEKMWKCNRKGRECVCLLHLYGFLKRDFYFIKVIKMVFMNFFIDNDETTYIHVFEIYIHYELFNYVLKVYVAYVNST